MSPWSWVATSRRSSQKWRKQSPRTPAPRIGWARGGTGPVTAGDVQRVRERQRELGIPETFEWVAETTPGLRPAVEETGLTVHEHPLLVLPARHPLPVVPTGGVTVRVLGPDDPALAGVIAVAHLAFGQPGTDVGPAGPTELAEEIRRRAGDGSVDRVAARIRAGITVAAAAIEDGTVTPPPAPAVGGDE